MCFLSTFVFLVSRKKYFFKQRLKTVPSPTPTPLNSPKPSSPPSNHAHAQGSCGASFIWGNLLDAVRRWRSLCVARGATNPAGAPPSPPPSKRGTPSCLTRSKCCCCCKDFRLRRRQHQINANDKYR